MIQCLSEHFSPTIPQGESCSFESFHAVPEISEFLLSVVLELPELRGQWEGKMVQGWSQTQRQARGQSIMKHTNTQLCVDSLPLFLPIHHNSPLIPLDLLNGARQCPSSVAAASGGTKQRNNLGLQPRRMKQGGPHQIPCCPTSLFCPTQRNHEKWKDAMSHMELKHRVLNVYFKCM